MMQNNTHASPNRPLEVLLKRAHMLVLIVLSGVILAVPVSAQSLEAAKRERGGIRGTVVDTSDDPIPGATVVLQGPAGDRLTAVTKTTEALPSTRPRPESPIGSRSPLKDLQTGAHPLRSNRVRTRRYPRSNFASWLCNAQSP